MRPNRVTLRRPAYLLASSIILTTVSLLAACGTGPQDEPSPTYARVIELAIENRSTALTREQLKVKQGETVSFNITSDEPGEVHLHGYDLTVAVAPEQPGNFAFRAETAGAFAINFHVLGTDAMHSGTATVVSEAPVSIAITAEPDAHGGVDVQIAAEGFQFAPDSVDQPHTPGAGHAHIYVDGVKLGRVFESDYHIDPLSPGQHEIKVSLNTNDHSELVYDGSKVESTATVTVPDVGQAVGDEGSQNGSDHGDHSHGGEREILAEVHLGNLEVYP